MKVLLIDVDSKIPNLALMKISAYHKLMGDIVGFNVDNPDKIYGSIIFKKNRHKLDGLEFIHPNAEIDIGGSGYDVNKKLPDMIESMSPDYSIYPENDSYYGFTTRGCIRNCSFCIVHDKEGYFHKVYDSPKEAIDSITRGHSFKKITFLDNNILADKEWFIQLSEYLCENYPKLKVDFNQGLDIRLLDDDIAKCLSKLRPIRDWKFAFDSMSYKDKVESGIKILKKYIDVRNKCLFYVYVDSDDDMPNAIQRAKLLKSWGTTAYSMLNADVPHTTRMKAFKRYTRPWIFWSCEFEEYGQNTL